MELLCQVRFVLNMLPAPDEHVVVRDVWDGALVGQVLSQAYVEECGAELRVCVVFAVVEWGVFWIPQDKVGYIRL